MSAWVGLLGVGLIGVLPIGCAPAEPANPPVEACVTPEPIECVVVQSGVVEGDEPADGVLTYQLQRLPNTPDSLNDCQYCGVAILRETDGRRELIGYVRGEGANWYGTPRRVGAIGGPLIVVESQAQGMGNFNDDVVFRYGDDDRLSRIDVQSWREDPAVVVPNRNTYFDWWTDYGAMVASSSLLSPGDWHRDPTGGCVRVFLKLVGDRLQVAAPPVSMLDVRC